MGPVAAISLLHPSLAAAGLVAGTVPLLIHLINRRRYRRVEWGAMVFLMAAARRRPRRARIEQWMLLLVRVLAILAIGLALARPYAASSPFSALGQSPAHRVLLLDNSASMGAVRADGKTLYEHAREVAAGLLDSFAPIDEISVVSVASPAAPLIDRPSFDHRWVRSALASLPPTRRATDLEGAFQQALQLLDKSSAAPENLHVYLISDLARHAWCAQDGAEAAQTAQRSTVPSAQRVAERAALVLMAVEPKSAENAGLSRLFLASTVTVVGTPVRFGVEVVNHGTGQLRGAVLQLRRDDRIARRITLPDIPPRGAEVVHFSLVFESPGSRTLFASLDPGHDDVFRLDNQRWLSIDVAESLRVLVVDGSPGRGRFTSQGRYLLTALNPWSAPEPAGGVLPTSVSDLELSDEVLSEYDVVVLCNVARLDEGTWQRLLDFVEDGGGLLTFAGDAVGPGQYNRLGYAAGAGVLPGRLEPPSDVPGLPRAGLGLARSDPAHAVMADFESLATSGLFTALVHRRMPVVIDESVTEVVLRYTDGAPAIVVARRGSGLSGFVTTTADMAWNNLPAKGDYVSLMMNLIAYLAQPGVCDNNIDVGQPIVRRVPAELASSPLRVRLPDGTVEDARLSTADSRFELRYADTEQVGEYTTLVANRTRHVAVNPPPIEGVLQMPDQAALAEAVGAPFVYADDPDSLFARSGAAGTQEYGWSIVYVVLALLLCETWLAARQGRG